MSAFDRQLVHTCDIQRCTSMPGAIGQQQKDWQDYLTNQPCRYVVSQQKIADAQMGLMIVTVYKILLGAGTDVTNSDRIANVIVAGVTQPGPFTIKQVISRNGPKGAAHILVVLNEPK